MQSARSQHGVLVQNTYQISPKHLSEGIASSRITLPVSPDFNGTCLPDKVVPSQVDATWSWIASTLTLFITDLTASFSVSAIYK